MTQGQKVLEKYMNFQLINFIDFDIQPNRVGPMLSKKHHL